MYMYVYLKELRKHLTFPEYFARLHYIKIGTLREDLLELALNAFVFFIERS